MVHQPACFFFIACKEWPATTCGCCFSKLDFAPSSRPFTQVNFTLYRIIAIDRSVLSPNLDKENETTGHRRLASFVVRSIDQLTLSVVVEWTPLPLMTSLGQQHSVLSLL